VTVFRPAYFLSRHRQAHPRDEGDPPRATVTEVGVQQIRRKPVLNGLINEHPSGLTHEYPQVINRILEPPRRMAAVLSTGRRPACAARPGGGGWFFYGFAVTCPGAGVVGLLQGGMRGRVAWRPDAERRLS